MWIYSTLPPAILLALCVSGLNAAVVKQVVEVVDVTTEAPPSVEDVLPLMNVRTNGVAESATTIEGICAAQYSSTMRAKADAQTSSVNSKINSGSLCAGRSDSIAHATVSVTSKLDAGVRLLFEFVNVLQFGGNNTLGDVVGCATEVGQYLNSHTNWAQPILPTQSGCDPLTFNPAEFPIEGNRWYCDVESATASAFNADNTLNSIDYDVSIYDVFAVDGSLSDQCANEFSIQGAVRADSVRTSTNTWMNDNADCAGVASITKYSSVFLSLQTEAYYQVSYQLSFADPEATTFNAFLRCMSSVTDYLGTHGPSGPWGDGIKPIPTPPGCPDLTVTSDRFTVSNTGWTCLDKPE